MIEFLTKIGVPSQYAGDVWLLIIFLIIGMILAVMIKKKNLGSLIMSVYVAYAILSFTYFLPENSNWKIAIFGALILVCFLGCKKIFSFSISGKKIIVWLQVLTLALLAVGMIGSLSLGWFSQKELEEFFTPFSKRLLISEPAQLFFTVAPFFVLVLMKKRRVG